MDERRAERRGVRDCESRERLVDREIVMEGRGSRERDRASGDASRDVGRGFSPGMNYSSRSAVTTGSLAARIAGSIPPTSPMISA